MDVRDSLTWVAIELTPQGEAKVEDGTLEKWLRSELRVDAHFPIFIPAVTIKKGSRTSTIFLMEGYVFVASGLMPETLYFRLEDKPYVERVMSSIAGPHKMRVISTVPNDEIEGLKKQLRDIIGTEVALGDRVRVVEGTYRSLEGDVDGKDSESAYVRISLRSMQIVATIPLAFLEVVKDEITTLDIPIVPTARQYGYLMWTAPLDAVITGFFRERTIEVWLGDNFLGLKKIDLKRRRIYLGQEQVLEFSKGKTVFVVTKRAAGGLSISCK